MKILIDPLYTGKPSTCSTSYLAWQIIEDLCAWRPDVFFYLLAPKQITLMPQESEWLKGQCERFVPGRVQLVPVDSLWTDRVTDMFRFPNDLVKYAQPGLSEFWDADVILTSRIEQISNFRAQSSRQVGFGKGTFRQIIGLDEMPIFSFRHTIPWADGGHMDLTTIANYSVADAVVINNLWTKQKLSQLARSILAPSRSMKFMEGVHEAVPVKLRRLGVDRQIYLDDGKFNVVFCGRMTGTRNFQEVAELFRKQFSYAVKDKKVRFLVSTQSESYGSIDPGEIDFIEIVKNDREAFHKMLKTRAHVVVNLSTVEDFSLSTYEPLLFGVPVIVPDRDWSDFLGPDYPFRADGFVQAYALVNMFLDDYKAEYDKFREWEASSWKQLVDGPWNRTTSEVVQGLVTAHAAALCDKLQNSESGETYRDIISSMLASTKQVFDLKEEARAAGLMVDKNWEQVPLAKRPNLHMLKVLANQAGLVDMAQPGAVRRAEVKEIAA
jgi:hypothetical protein